MKIKKHDEVSLLFGGIDHLFEVINLRKNILPSSRELSIKVIADYTSSVVSEKYSIGV